MTDIVERLRGKRKHVPDGIADLAGEMALYAAMMEEAADEIETLRGERRDGVAEIIQLRNEIERLRHPKIIVGSRKLWEAMGSEVAMDEATLAAITAYDNCTRLPEDVMGYGPMRAALIAALPHLQNAALKEKADD